LILLLLSNCSDDSDEWSDVVVAVVGVASGGGSGICCTLSVGTSHHTSEGLNRLLTVDGMIGIGRRRLLKREGDLVSASIGHYFTSWWIIKGVRAGEGETGSFHSSVIVLAQ
jgi:hypothetical protein